MAIRFEKLTVKNRDTGEVIVSRSIDDPNDLKFCVDAPPPVPAPERGPGLTRAAKLYWEITVKKLELPYEGPAVLVFDMIEPKVGIISRTGSGFHLSPYIMFGSFGPGEYEIKGYQGYPGYQDRVKYRMTVEVGGTPYGHGEIEDEYVLTFNPDMFVSEHERETVYFPKYYCQILWMRERFPRIAGLVDKVKAVR